MSAVVQLPIASLVLTYREFRLMPPEVVGSLRRSIERHGVLHPIVVNLLADGSAVVLDGFKRIEVLRARQVQEVAARTVHLTSEEAEAAIMAYNAPHRGLTALEEAWIVKRLARTHRLPQTRIAELVGRHKSWVSRRLALVERLTDSVQDDMRLGLVSATVARELVRLPRGNQPEVAHAVREHGLPCRRVHQLVESWRGSTEEGRRALLADPCRYLGVSPKPHSPPARDPRLSEEAEAVRQSLIRLESAARGFGQSVGRHVPVAFDLEQIGILEPPMVRARQELREALVELEQVLVAWLENRPEQTHEQEPTMADVRGGTPSSPGRVEPNDREGPCDRPADRLQTADRGGQKTPARR